MALCTVIGHARTLDAPARPSSTAPRRMARISTIRSRADRCMPARSSCRRCSRPASGTEDGARALLGIAVGVEVMCRLSLVAPKAVHKAGFHPTAVFGAMAAAAGVGERRCVSAAGAGQCAGHCRLDGERHHRISGGRRLDQTHASGLGSAIGICARRSSVAQGFVGPRTVLEGVHGLFHGFAHTHRLGLRRATDGFGVRWVTPTLAFKPYPCGTMAHPYIDCARRLAARGVDAERRHGDRLRGRAKAPCTACGSHSPPSNARRTVTPRNFRTPLLHRRRLLRGNVGLGEFTDAAVRDARVMRSRSEGEISDRSGQSLSRIISPGTSARCYSDGRVVEERQPHMRGGAHEPLTRADIEGEVHAQRAPRRLRRLAQSCSACAVAATLRKKDRSLLLARLSSGGTIRARCARHRCRPQYRTRYCARACRGGGGGGGQRARPTGTRRRMSRRDRAAAAARPCAIMADVADPAAVEEMAAAAAAQFGRLDMLINNAAVAASKVSMTMTLAALARGHGNHPGRRLHLRATPACRISKGAGRGSHREHRRPERPYRRGRAGRTSSPQRRALSAYARAGARACCGQDQGEHGDARAHGDAAPGGATRAGAPPLVNALVGRRGPPRGCCRGGAFPVRSGRLLHHRTEHPGERRNVSGLSWRLTLTRTAGAKFRAQSFGMLAERRHRPEAWQSVVEHCAAAPGSAPARSVSGPRYRGSADGGRRPRAC